MNEEIKDHKNFMEKEIDNCVSISRINDVHSYNTTIVNYFQSERIIHLIITLSFSLLSIIMIAVYILTRLSILLIPCVLLFALLIPYIFHYYKLENGVQGLYFLEKRILDKKRELEKLS